MPNILLYERVPDGWYEGLARFLREEQPDGLELELAQPEDDELDSALALLPEAHVLVVGLAGQQRAVCRRVFEEGAELKLVQKLGSRAFGVDLEAAAEHGVPVSLLPAPAHVACAEHTMLLILAAVKKLLGAHRAITDERADRKPRPTDAAAYACNWDHLKGIGLLAGKTLGLVGMGDIAVEVARRAKAFGMTMLYADEEPLPDDEAEELGVAFRQLDDLLAEADIVSLHAAHTEQTDKLISQERLGRMKRSAILVNTARGGLVDEEALIATLCKDHIAGAALDVWAEEPTPRDNPLLALDNVVATPHVAAGTLPPDALFAAIVPNIIAALRGEPVERIIEPKPAHGVRAEGGPFADEDETGPGLEVDEDTRAAGSLGQPPEEQDDAEA